MMAYEYEAFREEITSEKGQRVFVTLLHLMEQVVKQSGCITAGKAMDVARRAGVSGDSWEGMAFIDHLVKTGAYVRGPGGVSDTWQGAVLFPARNL